MANFRKDDPKTDSHGHEDEPGGGTDRDWSKFARRVEGLLPDLMKKATATGVKSFLQTEEGVRSLLGALLPRELYTAVGDQLERSKSEAVRLISREFREFLEKIDIGHELQRALTSLSIELKTEIRFVPNDRAVVTPSVRTRARVKTNDEGKKEAGEAKPDDSAPPSR